MSTYKSHYQVGLDPKIASRATIIFLIIIGLLVLTSGKAIYAGIQDGSLQKSFIQPFKDLGKALEDKPSSTYTITNTVIFSTPSAIIKSSNPPTRSNSQNTTNISSCIRYNIREGEFASNKCYSAGNYDDLQYYLQRFNSAVFSLNGAEASMRITCNGSDFFKDSCERDKKEKSQAEADISKYRGIIQGILAKGR